MRALLSIVIPTLNAEAGLAATLESLMEGLPAGLIREVVISDGGSDDASLEIADEAGCVVVIGAPSRGGQLARGAQAAQGEWLLFLHADTVLEPGWANKVAHHIKASQAGYFRLRFDDASFGASFVAGWANLRSRLLRLPYGDQGLLISAQQYQKVGGYRDIPLMEDVALARAMAGKLRVIPCVAVTSWTRYEQRGWIRRGARNLLILLRYSLGAAPERLAQSYKR